EHYSYLLEIENINKFALDQEESLLLSNKTLDNKTSTALDVEDMAVMYRNILPKIKLLSYEKSKKIKKLSEHLKALQNTHKELTQYKKTRDLKIQVSIPNVQTAEFEINYVIPDVHWT